MKTNQVQFCALVVLVILLAAAFLSTSLAQGTDVQEQVRTRVSPGRIEQSLTSIDVITNPVNEYRERAIIDMPFPSVLDSVHLDAATLVMTVSTVCDSTDPLILTVAPVTDRPTVEQLAELEDWTDINDGMNMRYSTITPMNSTQAGAEVRLDVMPIIDLWQRGVIPNLGVVVRTLSEGESTFQLNQTGAYDGANARLEVLYTRLKSPLDE
jgi:hypothetical protein